MVLVLIQVDCDHHPLAQQLSRKRKIFTFCQWQNNICILDFFKEESEPSKKSAKT